MAFSELGRKLYDILRDGDRHHKHELRMALDPAARIQDLWKVLRNVRANLPPGQMVVCETWHRKTYYRLVWHVSIKGE